MVLFDFFSHLALFDFKIYRIVKMIEKCKESCDRRNFKGKKRVYNMHKHCDSLMRSAHKTCLKFSDKVRMFLFDLQTLLMLYSGK